MWKYLTTDFKVHEVKTRTENRCQYAKNKIKWKEPWYILHPFYKN